MKVATAVFLVGGPSVVTTPAVVIRPIEGVAGWNLVSLPSFVNHIAPSGPVVIATGLTMVGFLVVGDHPGRLGTGATNEHGDCGQAQRDHGHGHQRPNALEALLGLGVVARTRRFVAHSCPATTKEVAPAPDGLPRIRPGHPGWFAGARADGRAEDKRCSCGTPLHLAWSARAAWTQSASPRSALGAGQERQGAPPAAGSGGIPARWPHQSERPGQSLI